MRTCLTQKDFTTWSLTRLHGYVFQCCLAVIISGIITSAVATSCTLIKVDPPSVRRLDVYVGQHSGTLWHTRGAMRVQLSPSRIPRMLPRQNDSQGSPPTLSHRLANTAQISESHIVVVDARGWPFPCLTAEASYTFGWLSGWQFVEIKGGYELQPQRSAGDPMVTANMLPLTPLWPQFLINWLFYLAVLCMSIVVPKYIRYRFRRAAGKCVRCGYAIHGAPSVRCPECGKDISTRRFDH